MDKFQGTGSFEPAVLREIKAALNTDTGNELKDSVNRKARERRLKGSLLKYDKIEAAVKDGNSNDERIWRDQQFSELLFIYFMGGSDEISTERALEEIEENEMRIKKLL